MKRDLNAEAIDAERAQIAHEIHDSLLPLIFAASAAVQRELDDAKADASADSDRLQQAATWLEEALRVGRQILSQTYPPELEHLSWDQAARQGVPRFVQHADATNIDWQIESRASNLSKVAAGACYRIVVEAIRNSIRHGKANQITVTATTHNDEAIVSIVDNGSGFDPGQIPDDRFGIRSMRARARLAGGNLRLESRPGGPTKVEFTVPMDA